MLVSTRIFVATLTLTIASSGLARRGEGDGNNSKVLISDTGFYWVPAEKAESGVSGFLLRDFSVEKVKDVRLKVEYQLPVELVGQPQSVEFEGSLTPDEMGQNILKGTHGTLTCNLKQRLCKGAYEKLNIDAALVEQTINSNTDFSTEEKALRLGVAIAFSTEPVGFILFK